MSSSKSSKFYRKLSNSWPGAPHSSKIDALHNLKTSIKNSWYYRLLPEPVVKYLHSSMELLEELEFSSELATELYANASIDLDTYKHNSRLQKQKNKKYSELRYKQYLHNKLSLEENEQRSKAQKKVS